MQIALAAGRRFPFERNLSPWTVSARDSENFAPPRHPLEKAWAASEAEAAMRLEPMA